MAIKNLGTLVQKTEQTGALPPFLSPIPRPKLRPLVFLTFHAGPEDCYRLSVVGCKLVTVL